jgi:opacity protein-like surface antigen
MKYAIVAAALAASALSLPAAAQMTFQHEISGSGSYSSLERSGTDVTVSTWLINYGYYFSPQLVGTVGLMRTDVEIEGSESDSTDLDIGAKYYFSRDLRRGALVPFVDGAIGVADSGGEDSDMKIRLGVGASYFINDSVSIDPSFSYVRISTEPGKTTGWLFGLRLTARF